MSCACWVVIWCTTSPVNSPVWLWLVSQTTNGSGCRKVLVQNVSVKMFGSVKTRPVHLHIIFIELQEKWVVVTIRNSPASALSINTFGFLKIEHNTQATPVVISQTHWLVSQERLSPRAGTSVFIDSVAPSISVVLTFEAGVSHHTPPLPGGAGLYRQF